MSELPTQKKIKWSLTKRLTIGYLVVNVLLFFMNPYASPWVYQSRDPVPMRVVQPNDADLSAYEIKKILDSIDLAYGRRQPTEFEQLQRRAVWWIQVVCLPSSFALIMKAFLGYLGPTTQEQAAFTLSVQRRYNHLARLAIQKGLQEDGFLFQENLSSSNENGPSFASVREQPQAPVKN
jgi:hypothetical protein